MPIQRRSIQWTRA
jgi:hypothetical protein